MTKASTRGLQTNVKALNNKGARNGKIDFLKFIFSLVIVIHHGKNVVGRRQDMFMTGGSFAVEFFLLYQAFCLWRALAE